MAAVQRNPKDSMKSTWRTADKSSWGVGHWLMHILKLYAIDPNKPVPKHAKTDKVPFVTQWSVNLWVIYHALLPMAIQQAYIWYYGKNMPAIAAYVLYALTYQLNAVHQIQVIRKMGHKYGFLDGDKHERDQVPDVGVNKAVTSLLGITFIRPLYTTLMLYRKNDPISLSWWLPVEMFLYSIVLDGWFYLYHRSCHEVDALWRYHRTHHLTKHPNTMLSSYADSEQEVIEMIVVPLLTWGCLKLMGLPMGFYDTWMCLEFLLFTEAFGHSGVRVILLPPGTSAWLLSLVDCELIVEDHDLHHRQGWKQSHNYGKQTRVWDRLFGTCHERIESTKDNIDYVNTVNHPLF